MTAPLGLAATIAAGASLGADRAFGGTHANADVFVRPVSIGAITAQEPFTSAIAAGIDPVNGKFGDGDDVAGLAGHLTGVTSRIAAIVMTGDLGPVVTLNPAVVRIHAFEAGAIAKVTLNGTAIVPTAAGIVIDTGANGIDDPNDIFIRLF